MYLPDGFPVHIRIRWIVNKLDDDRIRLLLEVMRLIPHVENPSRRGR